MAPVNRAALHRVAAALASAASLPDPAELGLPPSLPAALAAHAAAASADPVSARALAALPASGGGTATARFGAFGNGILIRTRDLVPGASDPLVGGAQQSLAAASAKAASQGAAAAKAQAAAILAAVCARLATGPADSAAVASAIGSVVPPSSQTPSPFADNVAATSQAPLTQRTDVPAFTTGVRWGTTQKYPPEGLPNPPASCATSPGSSAAQRWQRFAAPQGAVGDAPEPTATTVGGPTGRWQSLCLTTPSPASATLRQSQPQAPSSALDGSEPIPPVPCDGAALSSLTSTASLFRAGFGYSLATPGAMSTLADAMASFNHSTADLPPIAAATLCVLSGWGSLARGVSAVRDKMGVDLVTPDGGQVMSAALATAQSATGGKPAVWQESRAQAVMSWLTLDQAASALDRPTTGTGALGTLGKTLRGMAATAMPACQNPAGAAAWMSALNDVRTIRGCFGVDVLSAGAGDRLREIGRRVRDNLTASANAMAAAPLPSSADGLTYSALARFARIDRTQVGDLRLYGLRPSSGPVMTSAPLVLGTLTAIGAVGLGHRGQ